LEVGIGSWYFSFESIAQFSVLLSAQSSSSGQETFHSFLGGVGVCVVGLVAFFRFLKLDPSVHIAGQQLSFNLNTHHKFTLWIAALCAGVRGFCEL
jgi:hypothetical protein